MMVERILMARHYNYNFKNMDLRFLTPLIFIMLRSKYLSMEVSWPITKQEIISLEMNSYVRIEEMEQLAESNEN